jgi:hypothetical protein
LIAVKYILCILDIFPSLFHIKEHVHVITPDPAIFQFLRGTYIIKSVKQRLILHALKTLEKKIISKIPKSLTAVTVNLFYIEVVINIMKLVNR